MRLRLTQAHFVRVVVAGLYGATQYVAKLWFVVDQLQERLAAGALRTYTENIFRGWIQADDKQVCIQQNNAGAEVVENRLCVVVEGAVVTRAV